VFQFPVLQCTSNVRSVPKESKLLRGGNLSIKTVFLSWRLLEISDIVMKNILQDVDFAKTRLLNKKIFIQMRSGFDSEYTHLLYHTEFEKRNF
jgi:hypothetical protein